MIGKFKNERRGGLTAAILSLSLLTVMAGAAVAPALNTIQAYFSNIYLVLIFRSLVGISCGIIMPMSTGLLSFYFTRDKQDKLMGYSSAMNQMGGVIATLLAGILMTLSWRASFLVYMMGFISVVPCLLFLPNEKITSSGNTKEKGIFRKYYPFIVAMFIHMFSFFVYPSSFAMEMAKEGVVPTHLVAVIMAGMDLVAFFGGLAFVHIRRRLGIWTKYAAPALFFLGYVLLAVIGGWTCAIIGSAFVGFANGAGVPYIMSTAGKSAGRSAATTVMPMLSMALYLAQFVTPLILGVLGAVPPFTVALASSLLLIIWVTGIKEEAKPRHAVISENR